MKVRASSAAWGIVSLCVGAAFAALPSDAAAENPDFVKRGLDVFVDMPTNVTAGTSLPIQLWALGFPTATSLAPLGGATFELSWDPEALGPGISEAPPPVRATADANGRAHVDVPVPDGAEQSMRLLASVHHGTHHRTHEFQVHRAPSTELVLVVPDHRVVPGGEANAWMLLRNLATSAPMTNEPIHVELLEGGVARFSKDLVTDRAGLAVVRLPIPWTDEPMAIWQVEARTRWGKLEAQGRASAVLQAREETPGSPELRAIWDQGIVLPGDRVPFTLRLRDATGHPVTGAEVRYWIGPKGTSPPAEDMMMPAWIKGSTAATTDAAGEVHGDVTAPTNVRAGAGTQLRIVAMTRLFGEALRSDQIVYVNALTPSISVRPEVGQIVPGMSQRMFIEISGGRGEPISGDFQIEADGLSAKVTTDKLGEAAVDWTPPRDVGSPRMNGACAVGVAATVRAKPVTALAALGGRMDALTACVNVDRELAAILRPERALVTVGEPWKISLVEVPPPKGIGAKASNAPATLPSAWWSLFAAPPRVGPSAGMWVDPAGSAAITIANAAPGPWSLGAILPSISGKSKKSIGAIVARPALLAKLDAKVTGGRATPKGTVDVEIHLTDGRGKGVEGSVAAVMIDANGGGRLDGLWSLDERARLCRSLFVSADRCDAFFDDPNVDAWRRSVLANLAGSDPNALREPGATAPEELRETFKSMLLALEGAVMDATTSPDLLANAFRKEGNKYMFHPELVELAVASVAPAPVTPGGEPIGIEDLFAVDKQVTYDNVARRVTRMKLFRVLAAVRAHRQGEAMDPDEPPLRDPNAILRRLVRDGTLTQDQLVDPWGGTMQFVKAKGQGLPFMNVRGFELRSPGPDGKLNNADDVKSPFERVVSDGSPYATALGEDAIVDGLLDMQVSEATVENWRSLMEAHTGLTINNGVGFGSGYGRLGGSHRSSSPSIRMGATQVDRSSRGISTGAAFWLIPTRTDAAGTLKIRVPLGDIETTWRLALVAAADGAAPAVTSLDIPSALPLSARVDTGASWIEGDAADCVITVRNRTAAVARTTVAIEASGAIELLASGDKQRAVDVPAGGSAELRVRARAKKTGTASLAVKASAPGIEGDSITHTWDVRAAGENVDMTSSQWVDGSADLALPQVAQGIMPIGIGRVELERGHAAALEAALDALDPDTLGSIEAISYSEEAAIRIARWATATRGEHDPLAQKANARARAALGRIVSREAARSTGLGWISEMRAFDWAPVELASLVRTPSDCPPNTDPDVETGLRMLEAEPVSPSGAMPACWDALVSHVVEDVIAGDNVAHLASALIALAERPHRAALAASLAEKLRSRVALRPSGGISLPAAELQRRVVRALVFAALLRTTKLGPAPAASADRLVAWLAVQRDVSGGYGSAYATLAAVRALIASAPATDGKSKVVVTWGDVRREVEMGASGTTSVSLGPGATRARIEVTGAPVIARLIHPGIRLWKSPPADTGPLRLEVRWPESPRVGEKQVVVVSAKTSLGRDSLVDIRIPLPAGARLLTAVAGVRQVQGKLVIRTTTEADGTPTVVEIPLDLSLSGKITVPEAKMRLAHEEGGLSIAPAREINVR